MAADDKSKSRLSTGEYPAAQDRSAVPTTVIDAALADLQMGDALWSQTPLRDRIQLMGHLSRSVAAAAPAWVRAATAYKKLQPSTTAVGEEWITGPYAVLTSVTELQRTLNAIAKGKSPVSGARVGTASDGRTTIRVMPRNAYDRILLHGVRAEVWMKPGIEAKTVSERAGLGAKHPVDTSGVGLVLGAGNNTSIPPLDVLYGLIAENRVSILKLNPVMSRMQDTYTAALAPLIERRLLRIVIGGADVGSYLAHHPAISHVHITGSAATHDAVVWGTGDEAAARKSAGAPLLTKPITSELGGVSPIIVMPGDWSTADLRYQAEHVATQRLHNGGHNCIAGQVVVLSREWSQRHAFLSELRLALTRTPNRNPWYPGSEAHLQMAIESYPDALVLGERGDRVLVHVRDEDSSAPLVQTEFFSPVLGVIEIPGSGQEFLDAAVRTTNNDFSGTLGANIIGHPKSIARLGKGFERAISRLEYGIVAVNAWTGLGYMLAGIPWGAHPGHTIQNVQSGIGVVHNSLLLEDTEKTVLRGPFRPFPRSVIHGEFTFLPKPPWFVTARNAETVGKRLTKFAAEPSCTRLLGILSHAFRA